MFESSVYCSAKARSPLADFQARVTMSMTEKDAMRGTKKLSEQYQLFKSDTCGFCFRVRAYVEQLGMELPLRDVHTDAEAFRELLQGGGKTTVPCLRIERSTDAGTQIEWMYESLDIMQYLGERHASQ